MSNGCEIMKCQYWDGQRCHSDSESCIYRGANENVLEEISTLQAESKNQKSAVAWQKKMIADLQERDEEWKQIDIANSIAIADLKEKLRPLKEFARKVIKQYCWAIEDADPLDLQELGEKLKLIVPIIATKDMVDEESDFEVGDAIFTYSEILKIDLPTGEQESE